jgi:hypothetical protein
MTFYLVVSLAVSYDCPWGLSKANKAIKQLICEVKTEAKVSDPYPRLSDALRVLLDQGNSARIEEYKGTRKRVLPIRYIPEVIK